MIVAIEKDFLNDNFISKQFINNIKLESRIVFSKNNIYYFGNYKEDKLNDIKNKLVKNKKNINRAIENNVKFIVTGNSYNLFNNSFKHNDLNIFTAYNNKMFKRNINKIKFKKDKENKNLKIIYNLSDGINNKNFIYKNLLCVENCNLITKILKEKLK